MSFTPSFAVSQTKGSPSVVTITDDSTGSDVAITQRRAYLIKYDGTYLVPDGTSTDYVEWALADASIDIDALDKDYALRVLVQWLDVSNTVLYTTAGDSPYGFTLYNEAFDYQLTQNLSGNPLLMNDSNFYLNKSKLRTFIDSGDQAVSFGVSIYNAQRCYDSATEMRLQSQFIFNRNS